jgi:rod shape-determining protein MreC
MIRRRTLTLFVAVCLGHVLLISAQVQSRSGLPVIETVAFGTFAGVQRLTAGLTDAIGGGWTNYFALRGAARENAALKQRILDLEVTIQQQQALVTRTRSLEQALALKETLADPLIFAEVIAGNPQPGTLTVTINRGTSDGIREDMAAIGARGVVGRVISPVSPNAATVQLITGRAAALAVVFERSNAGGLATGGAADGLLRAEFVPVLADVQVGERVTTSGQDGIFPQGFLVGRVERVERSGADREIVIRPAVDFSHVDIVGIATRKPAAAAAPVVGSAKAGGQP